MQFQENIPWIDAFSANYHLGIDGISMPLIILTTFTTVLAVRLSGTRLRSAKTNLLSESLNGNSGHRL